MESCIVFLRLLPLSGDERWRGSRWMPGNHIVIHMHYMISFFYSGPTDEGRGHPLEHGLV